MLRSEEMLEMFFLSDRFAIDEKGILGIVVSKYRSTGEVVDFSGNERVADFFYAVIKPLIDKEKETAARTSKVRAAAGSKGGKAKAGKKNVANANNVAIVSDKAIVANAANANFAKASVKEPGTQLESGIASFDVSHQHSTSNNVVDGGDNNIIYNTTTMDEVVTEIGGGDLKEDTTVDINNSHTEETHPERESVTPPDGDNNLKERLGSSVTATSDLLCGKKIGVSQNSSGSVEGNVAFLDSPDRAVLDCRGNYTNITTTTPHGRVVDKRELSQQPLSEEQQKSNDLLLKKGFWPDVASEYALRYDYERIRRNVKMKMDELSQGSKIINLPAVIRKAIDNDLAGKVKKQKQQKSAMLSEESRQIISNILGRN